MKRQHARRRIPASASIGALRGELLRFGNPDPHGDSYRVAAERLGRLASSQLDRLWRSASNDGPIDVVDMFSGCGGMSTGFRAVNALVTAYKLIAAVDIDKVANESYERNLGLVPLGLDVSKLSRSRELGLPGVTTEPHGRARPLVLIGCAPCQGFSSHRNASGAGDQRNGLFVDFARVAARLAPDAVIVENVPELLTDGHWPVLERGQRILEAAGYTVHISIHNMADFGVPQERFRALLLAMRRPFAPLEGYLPRSRHRTVRRAIGNLPPLAAGAADDRDRMHSTVGHKESTLKVIRAVPKDGGNRPPGVGPDCLRRIEQRQGKAAYEDVYGRLFWDRPAITITAYARNPASGRFIHPEQDRGLSAREAALLQGFPMRYWFAGSLDDRFRQIGNAVPPRFAAYLAAHVLGELLAVRIDDKPRRPSIARPVGPSFSRLIPALKSGQAVVA